jgi:hypothetical protein
VIIIDTIKRNTQTLITASKEVGLELNAEQTKYISLSRHQNARKNHELKMAKRRFEKEAGFKYILGRQQQIKI